MFKRARAALLAQSLLLLLGTAVCPVTLHAEEALPDVRLLIDVSGSMRESDPNNLREPALELMLRLLPEGSLAGVWTFGRLVNMPVAHREVDELWREEASAAVAQINNHGLLTNIPGALERASYDTSHLDYRFKTSIILLTDGKVEVSENQAENQAAASQVLEAMAIELRDTGVEVHTIALSDNADHDFLQQLAQATGGLAEKAETADELTAVFLQALDIAAPTEQVPMLGGEFLIDESVNEFTALVFPEEGSGEVTLINPGQEAFTAVERPESVRWFQHERFQLITVERPEAGEWRIAAPGSIARVNILSHLTVSLDGPPTSLEAGHRPELGVRLMDSTEVVRDPDLLGLININARVERANSEQWEIQVPTAQVPASGEYRIGLPMLVEAGRYEIVVTVDGGSFQREQVLVTDVFAPRPKLELVPADVPEPERIHPLLLPALVPVVLLLALAIWWFRQRRVSRWDEDWEPDEEDPEIGLGDIDSLGDDSEDHFEDDGFEADDFEDDDFEDDDFDEDYEDSADEGYDDNDQATGEAEWDEDPDEDWDEDWDDDWEDDLEEYQDDDEIDDEIDDERPGPGRSN